MLNTIAYARKKIRVMAMSLAPFRKVERFLNLKH